MRLKRAGCGLAFLALIGALLLAALLYKRWADRAIGGRTRTVRVTITPGESVAAVGDALLADGLIRSQTLFQWEGRHTPIRPGVYDFTTAEAPGRILRQLAQGDFATIRVTIPEGFTLNQIAHRLLRLGSINDEAAFLTLATTQGQTFHAGFPLPANLEGYLFPDTYRIPIGDTDGQIIQEMLTTFDKRVAVPLAGEIAHSGHTLPEIVNVAAMVEREAEVDGDRPLIAGVIYNRLAKHMHLEIDATVQYAQGVHKNRLMYSDLAIDSPYNTYKVAGLPPTPICSPGLPSIEGAIHPTASEYLYYVARPDRSHVFARTFAEHEHNIAVQRQAARALRAASPSPRP